MPIQSRDDVAIRPKRTLTDQVDLNHQLGQATITIGQRLTAEDKAAIKEGWATYRRGEVISDQELDHGLGL